MATATQMTAGTTSRCAQRLDEELYDTLTIVVDMSRNTTLRGNYLKIYLDL